MEQTSLFDILPEIVKKAKKKESVKKPAAKKQKDKKSEKVMPTKEMLDFEKILENTSDLKEVEVAIARLFGIEPYEVGFEFPRHYYYKTSYRLNVTGTAFCHDSHAHPKVEIALEQKGYNNQITNLLYVVKDRIFMCTLTFYCRREYLGYGKGEKYVVEKYEHAPWKECRKLLPSGSYTIVNRKELDANFQEYFPYTVELQEKCKIPKECFFMAPQIEFLYKMGFAFVKNQNMKNVSREYCDCFNRLTKPGNNPKEFFKTEKPVYTLLKDEMCMTTWDTFRKLYKQGRITQDILEDVYQKGYSDKQLAQLNSVLAKRYQGKSVFTWKSLMNYLDRIDQYEAIEFDEGINILNDYLRMCSLLEMEPKTDGDSLKREHDICARLCRQRRNEILVKEMAPACNDLQKLNYHEDEYFIRGVESYDDLLDEAKQQHNCVASYAHSIAKRRSFIYVMREKGRPQKSFVTVEIDRRGNIRQKFMAYNQPIRNKEATEFLDRWTRFVKTKAAKAS